MDCDINEILKMFNVKYKDVNLTIDINYKEALKGTTKRISVPIYDISLQETYIDRMNTPFGLLNVVKSNGKYIKVADTRIKIKIPKRVKAGQCLLIRGNGNIDKNKKGDLYLYINVKNEPNSRLQ